MSRCVVVTAGMQCELEADHDGWHQWHTNVRVPGGVGEDSDIQVSWSWSETITRLPVSRLERITNWLDEPVFSRWYWPVWAAVCVQAGYIIVGWFR